MCGMIPHTCDHYFVSPAHLLFPASPTISRAVINIRVTIRQPSPQPVIRAVPYSYTLAMAEQTDQLLTPARQVRGSAVTVLRPGGDRDDTEQQNDSGSVNSGSQPDPNPTDATGAATTTPRESELRAQLLAMQSQLQDMQRQLTTNRRLAETSLQTQSREYWAFPITDTISYPGESASRFGRRVVCRALDQTDLLRSITDRRG